MFCGNCGNSREEKEKFCGNCGKSFEKKNSIIMEPNKQNNNDVKVFSQTTSFNNYSKPKTSNKFRFLIAGFSVFAFILLAVGLVLLATDRPVKNGKRTIMIYMVGSDLESKNSLGTIDINELIGNNIDFDKFNVLIYTGGAKRWTREEVSNERHMIFKVNRKGLTKLTDFKKENDMTKSNNLTTLLNYGYNNFKAEKYSLILWNHGGGPILGFGHDEFSDRMMLLNQLKEALRESKFGTRNKLEFIGFDACIMSSLEVAAALKDYANYLISSQENEPGTGWNYGFLEKISPTTSTEDVAKIMVDYYFDDVQRYSIKGMTLSLVDLSKVDLVLEKFDNLFKKANDNFDKDFAIVSRNRSYSNEFGLDPSSDTNLDLVDIIDLTKKFPNKYDKEKKELKSALESTVIYQKTDLNHANGLSVYFPYNNSEYYKYFLAIYRNLNFSKDYYNYIRKFSDKKFSNDYSNWRSFEQPKYITDDIIAINVEDDVINNYSNINYLIFEKTTKDFYTPIYKGTDVDFNGNQISTKVNNKFLKVSTAKGEMYLSALESIRGKDFVKYKIPVLLERFNEEEFNIDVISGFMEYVIDDERPEGYISTIVQSSKNNIPSKTNLNYKDFDDISFLSYKYKVRDENGNYIDEWEGSKDLMKFTTRAKEDFKISLVELDSIKEYVGIFRIKDSFGNVTNSEFIDIRK